MIADLDISMTKFTPKYDASGELIGTNIVEVIKGNLNGDIPEFLNCCLKIYKTMADVV